MIERAIKKMMSGLHIETTVDPDTFMSVTRSTIAGVTTEVEVSMEPMYRMFVERLKQDGFRDDV